MTTKLTLTIEEEVIKSAKKHAQQKGRSLSEMIENYLKTLVTKSKATENLSPRVRKIVGVVKLPDGFDYKETLTQAISEKYYK